MKPSRGWMGGVKALPRRTLNVLEGPAIPLLATRNNLLLGMLISLFWDLKHFAHRLVRAGKRISTFMQSRLKDLRRLSRAGSNLNLDHALAAYGTDQSSKSLSQSRFNDSDSESGSAAYVSERATPRAREVQRMRSSSRLRSETSPAPRQPPPLPEQVVPLRIPARRSPASSNAAPSESNMPMRSVRPGSIAELQRKYTRSPASSIDARRTNLRNDSLLKLSGGAVNSDEGVAGQNSTSASHW